MYSYRGSPERSVKTSSTSGFKSPPILTSVISVPSGHPSPSSVKSFLDSGSEQKPINPSLLA